MSAELNIEIDLSPYSFHKNSMNDIAENHWVKNQWPLVYFIENSDQKTAYVGESTNAFSRINNHLGNSKRSKLKKITLIGCDRFNKSATLDIESQLIQYITADGLYRLQNGNAGLQHHNYYQRDVYKGLFKQIWARLAENNLVKNTIEDIENSNVFKYSPYKSLSTDQHSSILEIVQVLNIERSKSIFVSGSAGTGKTILATYLMKLLHSDVPGQDEIEELDGIFLEEYDRLKTFKSKFDEPKIGLVVPMTSLRKTLKKVFGQIEGLKRSMVIGPSDVFKRQYDILLIDEAHRLMRRKNIPNYGSFDANNRKMGLGDSGTQLDWILHNSRYQVFFYDPAQSVKPSDIPAERFETLMGNEKPIQLKSQMRVTAGTDYINFVDNLLHCRPQQNFSIPENYDLRFFESYRDMVSTLREKEKEIGLSRLIAGYSWEWVSKNSDEFDIEIEGLRFYWNKTTEDWINSPNAANEIGCIHTTQGYDLNYAGIIFGHEITYNPTLDRIEIIPENYHDRNGKAGIKDDEVLKDYIVNIYKTIMYRGIKGTFVYACDPNLRAYLVDQFAQLQDSESSVKSISITKPTNEVIRRLIPAEVRPYENSVPLFDLQAAAGAFSDLQEVRDGHWVSLPDQFKPKQGYFVCQVVGESMNKRIPNGAYCLFEKYTGGTRQGKIVLVESFNIQDSEFGSGYTVKQYESIKSNGGEIWQHEKIILNPLSTDPSYEAIELVGDDEIQSLTVIGVFVSVL